MAAASPTPSDPSAGWLDDRQLSALSGSVFDILEHLSPRLKSDTDASDAISAVASAARSACAAFAGTFREHNPRAVTLRLPVDVLIAVLYATDMPTRIRASHASRALRDVALAEPGLWTVYRYKASREFGQLSQASLDFLQAILHRSDPLPIRLDMSNLYVHDDDSFASEIAAIITPSLHRLQVYEGRDTTLFNLLNPEEVPLRELVSLHLASSRGNWGREPCALRPQWLPNLLSLSVPVLADVGQPISSLRDLVCAVGPDGSQDVFRWFPNLVSAEFSGGRDTPLPPGPIPRSIEKITVHCEDGGFDVAALRVWAGETIPRLVLLAVQSLAVVSELLAAQAQPTVATILCRRDDFDVILADASDPRRWCWSIWTQFFWGFDHCIVDIQHLLTAVQIVSLTMSLVPLGVGFEVPHLLSLELSFMGIETAAPSISEWKPLHAPRLQDFVLDFTTADADMTADTSTAVLTTLKQNFRQLIVYDAELLETVTLRSTSRPPAGMDCVYFAQFARRYIDLTPD